MWNEDCVLPHVIFPEGLNESFKGDSEISTVIGGVKRKNK